MRRPAPGTRPITRPRSWASAGAAALAALACAATSVPPAHAEPASPTVLLPTVLLPNVVVPEGDAGRAAITVNVALSAPNPFDHAVQLEVVDYTAIPLPGGGGTYGTATPGIDYVSFGSFHLTFAPGQQVARFTVALKGDSTVEPAEEIDVRFDDTEFHVGDNDIDLVIGNDDGGAKPKNPLLLPPNQVMPEPDTGCFVYRVSVPVSRRPGARSTVQAVDFSTVPLPPPGSGTYGTATPGPDYLTFAPRTLAYSTRTRVSVLPVTLCGDTTQEIDEEVDVRFDSAQGIAIGDNDIDLVLADND